MKIIKIILVFFGSLIGTSFVLGLFLSFFAIGILRSGDETSSAGELIIYWPFVAFILSIIITVVYASKMGKHTKK